MQKTILTIFAAFIYSFVIGQTSVTGTLLDDGDQPVMFANIVFYSVKDSALVKVETTDENGYFKTTSLRPGNYYLKASYVGYNDLMAPVDLATSNEVDLGTLTMSTGAVQLETAVVTAQRSMVEVKPDRTVFNVQGTVNSVGDNGLGLLRKAPGVLVDNNNNVSVLGRTGVLFYLDGKRLPIAGDDLANFLQNIPAEQIDRIDIISNPGAKYEAEGNAGIVDIILKKDKNLGYNGTASATGSYGWHGRGNASVSGNYRNKTMNIFGTVGGSYGDFANNMLFTNEQNGFILEESNGMLSTNGNANVRLGTDFFLSKNSTLGFLVNSNFGSNDMASNNRAEIATLTTRESVDSILIASNTSENDNSQNTFNINYTFNPGDTRFNVDLDYGRYRNRSYFVQPNRYFDPTEQTLLTEILTEYDTPTDIDIYTFKADYEKPLFGGKLGLGTKFSKVVTKNTFLFYDRNGDDLQLNNQRSNDFNYDENVLAAYINYAGSLTQKLNYSLGLRAENTDALGDLFAYDPDFAELPYDSTYLQLFPSAGVTYMASPMHMWSVNYGRRINRPDYNVLNPFRIQLSELSFSKGNARLRPEIVNNFEVGYTYQYMYNFKLAYSRTIDQITRLIGPDDRDPRAGFISWDNLATQTVYSANISAPIQLTKWWSIFVNASANYMDNQADYGEEGTVDLQAFTYNFFQQSTFNLPKEWKAELSGWYSGPGIWGGVFLYDPSYSINVGLQRQFFNKKMNVRLNVSDITFQSFWSGVSEFNGLKGTGRGNWDSRRVALSVSYNFGNSNVKSRKRNTGLEDEAGRIGSGNGQ